MDAFLRNYVKGLVASATHQSIDVVQELTLITGSYRLPLKRL
jgi:hypothetical protein